MAQRKGKLFSGILGPVILKVVAGKQIASTKIKKGSMKKTPGMLKASNNFGLASKLGGKIRLNFVKQTKGLMDPGNCGRLASHLVDVLTQVQVRETQLFNFEEQSFDSVVGYSFNSLSPLRKWLLVQPEIKSAEGQMQIVWPKLRLRSAIRFPLRASLCTITMAVTFFRLEEGYRLFGSLSQQLLLATDQQDLEASVFSFAVPDGCLCLLGLFLNYRTVAGPYGQELNNEKFNPAGIAAAIFTPGEFTHNENLNWVSMIDLKFPSKAD